MNCVDVCPKGLNPTAAIGKTIEIGMILEISPLTVKNHVQKTLRKLNVLNRTQAVGRALALRIVNP